MIQPLRNRLMVLGLLLLLTPPARAQVGTGWTEQTFTDWFEYETNDDLNVINPAPSVFSYPQLYYDKASGIETFELLMPTSNRAEIRPDDNYSSGSRQFQAEVMIPTNSTTGECIHQVFNGSTGPYLLLRENQLTSSNFTVSAGGTLPAGDAYEVIFTNNYGAWFQLNSINSLVNSNTYVYYNGKLVWTGVNPGGTFYTKYGCYGTHTAFSEVLFSNATLFSGGTAILQDFSLSANPLSHSVLAGNNVVCTVSATFTNVVNNKVYFSVSNLPAGATARFSPASVAGSGTSMLTVSTSNSAPAGSYTLTIAGATSNSSDITHTTNVVLNILSQRPSLNNPVTQGNNLVFGGSGGVTNGAYHILASTNVALPITSWTVIATNSFDANGNFSFTNPITMNQQGWFYLLQIP